MYYVTTYHSPLGDLTICCDEKNLVGLWLTKQKYRESFAGSRDAVLKETEISQLTKCWLDQYFSGKKMGIEEIPLAPQGSIFRRQVWEILCEIPYGQVVTYGEIARKIADQRGIEKMSAQAVGGAVGHNPISIIIPCHRVVGNHGNLTGYGGGIEKKIQLLTLEGLDMSKFYIPKKGTAL